MLKESHTDARFRRRPTKEARDLVTEVSVGAQVRKRVIRLQSPSPCMFRRICAVTPFSTPRRPSRADLRRRPARPPGPPLWGGVSREKVTIEILLAEGFHN
jgi:hypothetical protein